jgi:hypothetical protein
MGGGGGREAKSYDSEKVWFPINLSILSGKDVIISRLIEHYFEGLELLKSYFLGK